MGKLFETLRCQNKLMMNFQLSPCIELQSLLAKETKEVITI